VWFQWWRYQPGTHPWTPEPAVRVFDSPDDRTAYSRALLARDSQGRLWVQAFRLEQDGRSTAAVAVSTDDGASFQRLRPALPQEWRLLVRREVTGRITVRGRRATVVDSSGSALGEPGLVGLATPRAGVWFDGFEVRLPR
jgi:hypothetical protein